MKDLSTGKTYLTKRTKQVAGPVFARAGYSIENLRGGREIMMAWANTLTDEDADCLLTYLKGAPTDLVTGDRQDSASPSGPRDLTTMQVELDWRLRKGI